MQTIHIVTVKSYVSENEPNYAVVSTFPCASRGAAEVVASNYRISQWLEVEIEEHPVIGSDHVVAGG